MEPTLHWNHSATPFGNDSQTHSASSMGYRNTNNDFIIFTNAVGVQYNLKKNECIQFQVEHVYGTPEYGAKTVIAKIKDFIGYPGEGVWGVTYSMLENDVWIDVATNKNYLADIHYNENIWNSIEAFLEKAS